MLESGAARAPAARVECSNPNPRQETENAAHIRITMRASAPTLEGHHGWINSAVHFRSRAYQKGNTANADSRRYDSCPRSGGAIFRGAQDIGACPHKSVQAQSLSQARIVI